MESLHLKKIIPFKNRIKKTKNTNHIFFYLSHLIFILLCLKLLPGQHASQNILLSPLRVCFCVRLFCQGKVGFIFL